MSFELSGERIAVDKKGQFDHPIAMPNAAKVVNLVARDLAGNEDSKELTLLPLRAP
jgi:hypothetical protein